MWRPAVRDDLVNLEMSPLQGYTTNLAWTDVFSAAQAEDLMEGKSKSCPTEACCSAVVDGPHERQRPGAHQFQEEDPSYQRQAVWHAAFRALGIFQQSSNQESLGTRREKETECKMNTDKKREHGGEKVGQEKDMKRVQFRKYHRLK